MTAVTSSVYGLVLFSFVLSSVCLTSWAAVTPDMMSSKPAGNVPPSQASPSSPSQGTPSLEKPKVASPQEEGQIGKGTAGQFDYACQCELTLGNSCGSRHPCCSPLSCQNGRCIDRRFCVAPGAVCPLGQFNCCVLDNQGCLVDLLQRQFTCQACIPLRTSCSPAIPQDFPGGCCPNSLCLNGGFGFFCYPTGNSFGLKPIDELFFAIT